MHFTPVIPPHPYDGGSSPAPDPPVIPAFSPQHVPTTPAWMNHAQAQGNFAAFPQQQFAQTPFLGVPGQAPGSYFIPPVALPQQGTPMAPVGPSGYSSDWTGFPNVALGAMGAMGGPPPGTPWGPAGGGHGQFAPQQVPGTGFAAFQQQPLPMGYAFGPWGGTPAGAFATPFAQPAAMPGGWPSHTPYHPQQAMPAMPGGGFGGAASAPAPPPSNTAATHHRPSRSTELADKIDKFSEDPIYGPVLDAFLVKVVKARIEMNPLLAPPPDKLDERPYLKWNLLFPSGQCQKSSDPGHRSWADGRGAPATWPRVKSLRLISRSIPWEIQINATDAELGVTCGDVIESIHDFMYGRVSKAQMDSATPSQKQLISTAYWHNRSTAYGVPGGRLHRTLLRCDWLGLQTMYGGIVEADERGIQ
ncbi:hypothetical protein EW026_g4511 [Hermanssonia centrifuga]|uniref:DUF6699 domain-containing protein n=1 Tax=Hermanssonia centrifuga TaxID=98765 RepID=A0A4S4KLE9_9APHY|nr:hypothetical protein EW026_g4511 [Hermanssonia centrifuga]